MMRRILIMALPLFLVSGILVTIQPLHAQTEDGGVEGVFDFGTGADMVGRGRAGIARPSEPSALYWNPAYLDRVTIANASFFHTSFLEDTPYDFFSVTYPTLHIGTFAAGLFRISTGDIQATDASGLRTGTFSYAQYRYLFSYGLKSDFLIRESSVGVNVKIDNQQMLEESATGLGVDVAFHQKLDRFHRILEGLDVGLVFRNLIAPSLRLSRERETLSRKVAFGVAKDIRLREEHRLSLFLDVDKNFKRYWRQRVGVEYDYDSFIQGRVGFNSDSFSAGLGVSYSSFTVDYAMRDSDFMTNHLVSISYRFGKSREQMLEEELERERRRVDEEARQRLETRQDEEISKRITEAEQAYEAGDYFAALGFWQGVLAWDEDNDRALSAIEQIMEELNRQQEQQNIDIANQAAVQQLFEAGVISYTQKRYDDAINSWMRVLEIEPDHDLALEYIQRATEEMQLLVDQHLARAAAYERAADYPSALNELHKATRYEPEDSDIERRIRRVENKIRSNDRFRKGLASYLGGNYEAALADFKQALDLNPGNALITEYIGLTESKMVGGTTEIGPEMERLYLEGVDLYLQGKYEEAIAVWNRILEKDPYNTKVLRNIDEAQARIEALRSLRE